MHVHPASNATSEPADPTRFTGLVWRTDSTPTVDGGLVGNRFVYAPGARSHWHVHHSEQALIVVEGRGLVSWIDLEEPHALLPGDWVSVTPGVVHWHGASASDVFSHLAVTAAGATDWLGPVSDADYERAQEAFDR
jgi:quercetin dioxygenase-like cupin family protein